MIKSLIALLLFSILTIPLLELVGIRTEIKSIKRQIKIEILRTIKKADYTVLKLSKKEIASSKEITLHVQDNEIEIEGEMYDIISANKMGDSIIFNCYHDHKESALKRKLYAQLLGMLLHEPLKSEQTKSIFIFFKNLYCQQVQEIQLPFIEREQRIVFFGYSLRIPNVLEMVSTPPPESFAKS